MTATSRASGKPVATFPQLSIFIPLALKTLYMVIPKTIIPAINPVKTSSSLKFLGIFFLHSF